MKFTRRGLWIGIGLSTLVIVVLLTVYVVVTFEDLKSRSVKISVGMHGDQVTAMFGKPALVLNRTNGRGSLMVWVDQLWQLDVLTGRDGRVESVGCMPSDSFYRRTMASIHSIFK